jgi:DcaP outer membrane protein
MKTSHQSKAITTVAVILVTSVWLVISQRPALAQSQDPEKEKSEVQLLKEKMQLLEQTVEGLKAQLKAIEDAKKAASAVATGEKVGVTATTSAPAADVGTTPATPGAKPDDPPGESTFEIYGFAMLDMGYQFKQADPNWFDTVRPVKLPAFRDQFLPNGNFFSSVRQSRLGVKSSTPTKYGELKTVFEFELFGTGVDAGQTTFRLRHAYGELGKFGAGQYWSMFVDPDVFPNTNEYWGPNGIVWYRNVQFRWMPLKGRNSVTIGLERPGASADLGRAADRIELTGVRPRFPVPDLTGNVRFTRDWGHVQIGGVLRYIKWEDNVPDAFDLSGSATGAGIGITSVLNFNKSNTGKFSFVYGHGIQNYMNDAPVDVGIELNPGGGPRVPIRGVALPVTAFMAYLDHRWGERWTSSIGYSILHISNSDGQTPDAFRRGHYGSGNLLFYPVPNVMVGSEIIWGRRENFLDGFSSEDVHLQFSFKYNFSKAFKF